jgi:benzylsuccinate CoA-transferase BbsE subunit
MITGKKEEGLLGNIKVLDLCEEEGSFCSKLLSDIGARVIKVENPDGQAAGLPGSSRRDSPCFEKNWSFLYNNANKLSITLNIESSAGREIFIKLIRNVNIIIESFPPGYLGKLQLGFDSLTQINPGIILASITGYGQAGPRRNYKFHDLIAAAWGGQVYVSGPKSAPPVSLGSYQSDSTVSLFCAVAIVLAIRKQRLTGQGCHLDLSAQEAVASTLDHIMVDYFYDKTITTRQGGIYGNNTFCILPCKDGYIQLTILSNWETLLELMTSEGKEEDLGAEKWQDGNFRGRHFEHLVKVVGRWTKGHTKNELFELGQAMRFPWTPIESPREVLKSPQLLERRFFTHIKLSGTDAIVPSPGIPYRFSSFSPPSSQTVSFRGEHTIPILEELAISRKRIRELSRKKVI